MKLFYQLIVSSAFLFLIACEKQELEAPYQSSKIIEGIQLDWSTHIRKATGSDNWPTTWGNDDQQYSSWGDGGGFNGSNKNGRVSLGVAKIEGDSNSIKGINIYGGKDTASKSEFEGKSYGLVAIGEKLYMWVSPGSNSQAYIESRLYISEDLGGNWTSVDWVFSRSDGLVNPTFCQFGKAYTGSRDGFVYMYANNIKDDSKLKVQKPGEITLMRAPKNMLNIREAYEFYVGSADINSPEWTKDINKRMPVFQDKNGVGWNLSVSFNQGLKRYFLMTEHAESFNANVGLFDSPEPWGPWSTIYYDQFPLPDTISRNTFFYNFSNKWMSQDGLNFTLIFTGVKENDSWNSINGKFTMRTESKLPTVN